MHFIDFLFQATEFAVRGPTDGVIPAIGTVGAGTDCANDWISIEGMYEQSCIPTVFP